MKRLLLAIVLGIASGTTIAGPTPLRSHLADLRLNPPVDARCTLSLGNGTIDYGSLTRAQLQDVTGAHKAVTPGKRTILLTVVCPYTQSMQLVFRGDQTPRGYFRYGEHGSLRVRLAGIRMDGRAVQAVSTTPDGGVNGEVTEAEYLKVGQTISPSTNGKLARGKVLTARLEVEPILPEKAALVSHEKTSEANVSIELLDAR